MWYSHLLFGSFIHLRFYSFESSECVIQVFTSKISLKYIQTKTGCSMSNHCIHLLKHTFFLGTEDCWRISFIFLFKLKDLLRFLFLAVFVVLGVGIYYHTNLWPDYESLWDGGWTNWRIWTILYYPYWQLYAEINLDHLDG